MSQSTVSRALRGDPRVTPETRVRVEEVARRLDYQPNAAAQSLITSRSHTVAVVVAGITNPFYPELVDVLHDELSLAGYRTVLLNERTEGGSGEDLMRQLPAGAVDGVVFLSATTTTAVPRRFLERGMPIILLNREVDDCDADRVISDNVNGGQLVADALLRLGHRRIGLIAGPENTSTSRDREAGFHRALKRRNVHVAPAHRRVSPYTHQGGYQCCIELLSADPPPSAIFCGNDVIAFGALDAAKRMGVNVPGTLAVIGYDDIEMAGWERFSLTTVRQPLAQMAKAAARMLLERIDADAPPAPRRQVFPAGLVVRESTGGISTADGN